MFCVLELLELLLLGLNAQFEAGMGHRVLVDLVCKDQGLSGRWKGRRVSSCKSGFA